MSAIAVGDKIKLVRTSLSQVSDQTERDTVLAQIDALEVELQALKAVHAAARAASGSQPAPEVDPNAEASVNTFLTTQQGTFEEKRKALSDQVRHEILQGTAVDLHDTKVDDELSNYKESGNGGDARTNIRALNAISVFKGGSDNVWRQWEHP